MNDRTKGCVVVFDRNIGQDDAEAAMDAVRMVKGVASVYVESAHTEEILARHQLRQALRAKLDAVLDALL